MRDPVALTEKGVKEFSVSWFLGLKEGLECRGQGSEVIVPCSPVLPERQTWTQQSLCHLDRTPDTQSPVWMDD